MVAGIGGIGKSTFLNLFFKMYKEKGCDLQNSFVDKALLDRTVSIEEVGDFVIKSSNVDIHFHLIDTPGYGDKINNQFAIDNIKEYLEAAHRQWSLLDTRTMTRKELNAADTRIHCIFYFISPHRMKLIDFEFILQLGSLAPIVPVIAKADTMTSEERRAYLEVVDETLRGLEAVAKTPIIFDFEEPQGLPGFLSPRKAAADEEASSQPQQADLEPDTYLDASDTDEAPTTVAVLPIDAQTSSATATQPVNSNPFDLFLHDIDTASIDRTKAARDAFASSLLHLAFSDDSGESPLLGEHSCSYPASAESSLSLSPSPYRYQPSRAPVLTRVSSPEKKSDITRPRRFSNSDYQDEYDHSHSSSEEQEVEQLGQSESDSETSSCLIRNVSPSPLPRLRNVFAVVCDVSPSGLRAYQWGETSHTTAKTLRRRG
eukprot:gene38637-47716_t